MDSVPTDLNQLSDYELLCLAVWREASNQMWLGWICVAHVIRNRVLKNSREFGGNTYHSVITKPYAFSSFNEHDPNCTRWPHEDEPAWQEVKGACFEVYNGLGISDPTNGALFYWSHPLTEAPHAWGNVEETYRSGMLHFCKPIEVEEST